MTSKDELLQRLPRQPYLKFASEELTPDELRTFRELVKTEIALARRRGDNLTASRMEWILRGVDIALAS